MVSRTVRPFVVTCILRVCSHRSAGLTAKNITSFGSKDGGYRSSGRVMCALDRLVFHALHRAECLSEVLINLVAPTHLRRGEADHFPAGHPAVTAMHRI